MTISTYRLSLLVSLFLGFLLFPLSASADTTVSAITSDTTWSPSGGVYLIRSNFSVSPGVTLTIAPGTIIKASSTGPNGPSIYGNIVAQGTVESPIYFTSLFDDSVGGDTDGGGFSVGHPGEWQGLYFKPGSTLDLNYTNISYAGYGGFGYGDFVGIENDGGNLDIKNSNIHHNSVFGIKNLSGTLSVQNSIVSNQTEGIFVESGTTTISNSEIKNNSGEGLAANGEGTLTLMNNIFSGNGSTATVSVSKQFVHSGNTSSDIKDRGFVMTGIARDGEVLDSNDLPIIVNGSIVVSLGDTLTIAPGTILKFGSYPTFGSLVVQGTLIASGTPQNKTEDKIYMTSIRDDSVGGDTNGDGAATTPAAKDWNAIFLNNGSKVDINNAVIRYSGYNYNGEYLPGVAAVIYQRGADLKIDNTFIGFNNLSAGIFQDAGTTTITRSEITKNSFGLRSRGGLITISDSNLHDSTGLAVYNESGLQIDARNNFWGDASGPHDVSTSTPTGSGDNIQGDVLYIPFLTSDPLLAQDKINPVIIIPGIMGSAYKNGDLVIDPILHTYDDLIETLDANGYTPGVDLFTFPYEWRDSNVLTANLLKDKITEVKQICLAQNLPDIDCSKVDLVAHSMGGLVAREYIQSGQYAHDVDQLIFLGTPHKGSPKSYLQWEAGQFPPGLLASLQKQIFTVEAFKHGYTNLFDYIQNRPISSVQELLPTFGYLKDKDTNTIRTYPNNYPRNIFLESLNGNISNLLNSEAKITNIVGNIGSSGTINIIRVASSSNSLWVDGKPDGFDGETIDRGLENGYGDGTVTLDGATLDSYVSNEEFDSSHSRLPTETEARVFNILTGKIATDVFNSIFIEKLLSIHLESPIDFVITAPNGKKIGKNFVNNTEYDEIPGAFYSGFKTDEEYITIPNPLDGEYKVETQGTGNGGSYGILTSYITDTEEDTIEVSGTTLPNEITKFKVTVIDANTNPIDIDLDAPNTSTITISSPESRDYLRSEKINISASSKTGVLSLLLLGKSITSGSLFDPFYAKLGTTTLSATSSIGTKAVATSSATFRIIANYDSTISDIERSYSLGWVYSLNIKNDLINKINKAVKGEEKIDSLETQKAGAKKITKTIEKLTKKVDKDLLKALKIDLDAYRKDKLNDQAYNIIKEDLDWLILNN